MEMNKLIEDVKSFMVTGGQPVSEKPTLISPERSELRFDLGTEELKEYRDAVKANDLVEIADALGDQLYILLGTILEHGLQDHIVNVFKEIQRSNMTKFHNTEDEANATIMYYKKNGEPCTVELINEKYVVFNQSGKVKKNIHYSPAVLEPILNGDQHGFTAEEIKEAVVEFETIEAPHPKNKKEDLPVGQENMEISKYSYNNVIFLGIKGKDECKKALEVLNQEFPETHVVIFDKEVYNKVSDIYVRKHIDWKEQQSIQEFTTNPENMQSVYAQAVKVKEACGQLWFTEKNMVENTNMTYKQVKDTLELLFAFGFVAFKFSEKGNKVWKVLLNADEKIAYLENLKNGALADADSYVDMIKMIQDQENKNSKV